MTTTEILRIKTARDTIRAKLVALGLAESSEKIDSLATIVDDIPNNGAVSATVKEGETIPFLAAIITVLVRYRACPAAVIIICSQKP